jgi:hypothetical protein
LTEKSIALPGVTMTRKQLSLTTIDQQAYH